MTPRRTEELILYGLRVSSELPLHQDRGVAGDGPVDVRIHFGAPADPTSALPGTVVLDYGLDRQFYTAVRTAARGYVLRFHGTCDFVVDQALTDVTVHVVDGADADRVGVLAAGSLLSFLLALRAQPVLHASAVQIGEEAIAFVGASGMGKSTMATLVCADGGTLITDDVLRLELDGISRPRCRLGATELRLRKAAAELSARFVNAPGRRTTADSRQALRVRPSTTDNLPLSAIVVPMPDHSGARTTTDVARLDAMDALITLTKFPRLIGWTDPAVMDRQFHELAALVEVVPVFTARVPWGPPFPPNLATSLLEGLAVAGALALAGPDGA